MQTKQRYYLAELSSRILLDKMEPEDRDYLASCIYLISLGNDPREVFSSSKAKGSTGERDKATIRKNMAISLIAALIRPRYKSDTDFSVMNPSGEGLSEEEALERAYEFFKSRDGQSKGDNDDYDISFATLQRYWSDAKKDKPELLQIFVKYGDLLPK